MNVLSTSNLHPQIRDQFESFFGRDRCDKIVEALGTPSLKTTLRVNLMRTTCQEVLEKLPEHLYRFHPHEDPEVPGVIVLHGEGPCVLPAHSGHKEVLLSRKTGEAVLRGAHVFCPGVLATSPGLEKGDTVLVSIYLGKSVLTRGSVLDDRSPVAQHDRRRIGIGVSQVGRSELFRSLHGCAIVMTDSLYLSPPCNGVLPGDVMLQNLPSIVAAQVMNPRPGWKVLDMCAAPGGKTTAMAEWMGDRGEVIALDRTHKKATSVQALATERGLSCITVYKMDATKAADLSTATAAGSSQTPCSKTVKAQAREARREATRLRCRQQMQPESVQMPTCQGFNENTFDGVLLDPPCSALGLRPRLDFPHSVEELHRTAQYQRRLLDTAVKLVAPGGTLVYSTCTIHPGENEVNVRYVLDAYPSLRLRKQDPYIGCPGFVGPGYLHDHEACLVQRFHPDAALDTIGFFIAAFTKTEDANC